MNLFNNYIGVDCSIQRPAVEVIGTYEKSQFTLGRKVYQIHTSNVREGSIQEVIANISLMNASERGQLEAKLTEPELHFWDINRCVREIGKTASSEVLRTNIAAILQQEEAENQAYRARAAREQMEQRKRLVDEMERGCPQFYEQDRRQFNSRFRDYGEFREAFTRALSDPNHPCHASCVSLLRSVVNNRAADDLHDLRNWAKYCYRHGDIPQALLDASL